ncbi:unnamed protein product [Clavelina lepadiformis]|uniref:Uncharacterized protein n=1 Tax=Clavelina lepadiformis TaxID=159417 RepID=A0ABP0EZL4_CLALP
MWKILICIAVILVVYQFKITTAEDNFDGSREVERTTANMTLTDAKTTPAATTKPKTLKFGLTRFCIRRGFCQRLKKSMVVCKEPTCLFCQKFICNVKGRQESPL